MFNRRRFLKSCSMAGSAWLASPLSSSAAYESVINRFGVERKPNIIVILADDLGYGDLSYYGNKEINTPYIDALIAGGIYFTDFHSSAPVCSPTRAGLLCGQYQQRIGVTDVLTVARHQSQGLNPDVTTFPKVLQPHGYKTAIFGKWHLGYRPQYNPLHFGFDRFRGFVSGNVDYHSHINQAGELDWWHDREPVSEEGYTTHLITRHALEFVQENKDRPFCMYMAYPSPHYPYQGPKDPVVRYPGVGRLAQNKMESDPKAYKAMIEEMDRGIGTVWKRLRELDLEKDTFVFFLSDNGATQAGSNGRLWGYKGGLYEGGHRVPAFAYYPRVISPGRICKDSAISLDLFPTLLSAAGIEVPEGLDGVDLLPRLTEDRSLRERSLFWEYKSQQSVRKGRWKLVVTKRDSEIEIELFDLEKDESEENNVAPMNAAKVESLLQELKEWEEGMRSS